MDQVQTWGAVAAALTAIVTALYVGGRWVWRTLRRVDEWLDDWYGDPGRPGVPARLGVPERLARLEEQVTTIAAQVQPNGGSTLRDAVARIEESVSGDPPH